MMNQIRTVAIRSQDTLLGDAVGAAALMIMLVGCLYLPGLVSSGLALSGLAQGF